MNSYTLYRESSASNSIYYQDNSTTEVNNELLDRDGSASNSIYYQDGSISEVRIKLQNVLYFPLLSVIETINL
jgi:hypothetical protein